MIQFAIIIPFRPKAESVNWAKESALLKQTIQSVLRQRYSAFKVFVIYTDYPDAVITDEQVEYIPFQYGYQTYNEIENKEMLFEKFKRSTKMVVQRWDKARKLTYGSKLAKEQGFDYLMALDADDLLSNRILSYLAKDAEQHQRKGWYMEKGYLHKEHTNYLIKVPKGIRFLNGSTNVLHSDFVEIPDFNSQDWNDYNLFTDHGWVKERIKKYYDVELTPLPDPMLVYVVHQSNISKVYEKEFGKTLKNFVKLILRGRILTKSKREEFNIQ